MYNVGHIELFYKNSFPNFKWTQFDLCQLLCPYLLIYAIASNLKTFYKLQTTILFSAVTRRKGIIAVHLGKPNSNHLISAYFVGVVCNNRKVLYIDIVVRRYFMLILVNQVQITCVPDRLWVQCVVIRRSFVQMLPYVGSVPNFVSIQIYYIVFSLKNWWW